MRIYCPFCGERDLSEFGYHGAVRDEVDSPAGDAQLRFFDAAYLRRNPEGPHDELWYHASGCRSWLHVKRDTRTHQVLAVNLAKRAGEP